MSLDLRRRFSREIAAKAFGKAFRGFRCVCASERVQPKVLVQMICRAGRVMIFTYDALDSSTFPCHGLWHHYRFLFLNMWRDTAAGA